MQYILYILIERCAAMNHFVEALTMGSEREPAIQRDTESQRNRERERESGKQKSAILCMYTEEIYVRQITFLFIDKLFSHHWACIRYYKSLIHVHYYVHMNFMSNIVFFD